MYSTEGLSLRKMAILQEMDDSIGFIDEDNEDFIKLYKKSNFLTRYILRKQVTLLKYHNKYVGYSWVSKIGTSGYKYNINSLYIDSNYYNENCDILFYDMPNGSKVIYELQESNLNNKYLEILGFNLDESTLELKKELLNEPDSINNDDIQFIRFKKGEHEKLRCNLQNEIFSSNTREPLTVKDILLDEIQEYFVAKWCIILRYKNDYIGYGQIIKNNKIPTIVNFGLLKDYRGKGFGKTFLNYLLKLLFEEGYKDAKIRVNCNNTVAYKLYKKIGFNEINKYNTWIYTK